MIAKKKAKEKAKELIDEYITLIDHQDHYWGVDLDAKKCALLCVEVIQTQVKEANKKRFWSDVVSELEKY